MPLLIIVNVPAKGHSLFSSSEYMSVSPVAPKWRFLCLELADRYAIRQARSVQGQLCGSIPLKSQKSLTHHPRKLSAFSPLNCSVSTWPI